MRPGAEKQPKIMPGQLVGPRKEQALRLVIKLCADALTLWLHSE